MKLRRLQIENFRGIPKLDLELGDVTVLIGENNTGKTAVLEALRFALREVRSRRGCAFKAFDFHLAAAAAEPSQSPPIIIGLTFREDNPGEWDDKLVGRLGRAKFLQTDAVDRACVIFKVTGHFNPVRKEFVQDWEFQNVQGEALKEVPDWALPTFQNEVSYYYLAAMRDAARNFDVTGVFWRPFLKESQLTSERRGEIESKLAEINQIIIESHGSFGPVLEKLREIEKILPLIAGNDLVSVDAVPGRIFEMLAKAQLNLNTETGAKVPVVQHGEGMQSLAVLLLFNAYLNAWGKENAIVALEEPEAHLHPSAVRALWQVINGIPGQKIISTHSGDLLSEVPADAVIRLYRQGSDVKGSKLQEVYRQLDGNEQRKFNFNVRSSRGELLFARCWILGEGETEATIVPEAARGLQKDLHRLGIRFVTYQTGISLETALKVAEGLGIKWVVLTDNDQMGRTNQGITRNYLNGRVEADTLFVMPQATIEQYLCQNGFLTVYENLLSDQPRRNLTVLPGDPDYPRQVAEVLPSKYKTQAAQEIGLLLSGPTRQPVPQLIQDVIDAAIKLAEAP